MRLVTDPLAFATTLLFWVAPVDLLIKLGVIIVSWLYVSVTQSFNQSHVRADRHLSPADPSTGEPTWVTVATPTVAYSTSSPYVFCYPWYKDGITQYQVTMKDCSPPTHVTLIQNALETLVTKASDGMVVEL